MNTSHFEKIENMIIYRHLLILMHYGWQKIKLICGIYLYAFSKPANFYRFYGKRHRKMFSQHFSWMSRIWTNNASLLEKLLPQERQRCPPVTGNWITLLQNEIMRVKYCFYGKYSCVASDHLDFLTVYHNIHNHNASPCCYEYLVYEF